MQEHRQSERQSKHPVARLSHAHGQAVETPRDSHGRGLGEQHRRPEPPRGQQRDTEHRATALHADTASAATGVDISDGPRGAAQALAGVSGGGRGGEGLDSGDFKRHKRGPGPAGRRRAEYPVSRGVFGAAAAPGPDARVCDRRLVVVLVGPAEGPKPPVLYAHRLPPHAPAARADAPQHVSAVLSPYSPRQSHAAEALQGLYFRVRVVVCSGLRAPFLCGRRLPAGLTTRRVHPPSRPGASTTRPFSAQEPLFQRIPPPALRSGDGLHGPVFL